MTYIVYITFADRTDRVELTSLAGYAAKMVEWAEAGAKAIELTYKL